MAQQLKTGDLVEICCADRRVPGTVHFASPNGKSLFLTFEAILDGCVGRMPVSQLDDGSYQSVITGTALALTLVRRGGH